MTHTSTTKLKHLYRRMRWNMTLPNLMLWVIPYHRGVQIQRTIFSKRWVQKIFYSRQVDLLTEISGLMGDKANDLDETIICSLMSNTWKKWRIAAFHKLGVSDWGIIIGLENLTTAHEKGKGIILVTAHSFRTSLLRSVLHSHSLQDVYFVHKFFESSDRAHMVTAYARQLADALKVLKSGGVLAIAGDGTMGEGGFKLPFFGRLLTFRSGFADMSLRSEATVLPVYEYLQNDGRVVLEISSPLTPGNGSRENQLESIVRQYVGSLTDHWPKLIPSLSWFKLKQFLTNPDITNISGSDDNRSE